MNKRQSTRRALVILVALSILAVLAGVAIFSFVRGSDGDHPQAPVEATRVSGDPPGLVTIAVSGTTRTRCRSTGRFSITGAISDHGKFVDDCAGLVTVRKLIGAKGTIWIKVGYLKPVHCQCNWRIVKGTGRYSDLRGHGTEAGLYLPKTVGVRMQGSVVVPGLP